MLRKRKWYFILARVINLTSEPLTAQRRAGEFLYRDNQLQADIRFTVLCIPCMQHVLNLQNPARGSGCLAAAGFARRRAAGTPRNPQGKNGEDRNGYFCSTEIFSVAQNDSSSGENAPCLQNHTPLLQVRWTNRILCASISTLIFWDTDTTHRSCRAGRWVRENVYPLK